MEYNDLLIDRSQKPPLPWGEPAGRQAGIQERGSKEFRYPLSLTLPPRGRE
ncbi:hypothetical protein HYW11_00400 [Candidatus Peregrinibacteria bacterium]|nr:hypothetical protein [Candidatus Peregrinibacteria bacterium]